MEYATGGLAQKLFISRYLVALPSAKQLVRFLEQDRDRLEALWSRPVAKPAPAQRKKAARTPRKATARPASKGPKK